MGGYLKMPKFMWRNMCMARLVPEVSLKDSLKQCHIGMVLRELDVKPGSDFHVVF